VPVASSIAYIHALRCRRQLSITAAIEPTLRGSQARDQWLPDAAEIDGSSHETTVQGKLEINDDNAFEEVSRRVYEMLRAGRYDEAVTVTGECSGEAFYVLQLRALALTESGQATGNREQLLQALPVWDEIEEIFPGGDVKMNRANAEQGIAEVTARSEGHLAAFTGERDHLQRARELFEEVGKNEENDTALRAKAWTNRGNAFDLFGRDFEALDSYGEAVSLDRAFGMAQGNIGVTLLGTLPLMNDHQPMVVTIAAMTLDAALADDRRVLEIGGPTALEHFRTERSRIKLKNGLPSQVPGTPKWDDPYLAWCALHGLFLHVSPDCITVDADIDPLYFSRVFSDLSDESQERVILLGDAFNAVKQDYLSTRYLAWLATEPQTPVREHASELSKRAVFWDGLNYSRWGAATGLASQALAAAVNLLDKIASFVHLYLGTGRVRDVYFTSLWHRRGSTEMDESIAREIEAGNRGLLALCDLSADVERPSQLKEFIEHRHAATHRFLVTHWMLMDDRSPKGDWLERVEWDQLTEWLQIQLRAARAALIYLARTVDIHESRAGLEALGPDKQPPSLRIQRASTEDPEF